VETSFELEIKKFSAEICGLIKSKASSNCFF
jgi:hypothetical protein